MILYKYLLPDRTSILDQELVRFTHPSALNDLTELRPAFGTLLTKEHALRNINLDRIADEATKAFPESVRQKARASALTLLRSEAGRLAIDTPVSLLNGSAHRLRSQMYEIFDQQIGVFSLSEAWDIEPMWAHYADQHRGFVIGLDDSSGYFHRRRSQKDEFYHLRQVAYADLPSTPRSFSDLSDGTKIFLIKDKSWSYEREWRMLVPLSGAAKLVRGPQDDPVHLFPLPGAVVSSIIIGTRASRELKARKHHKQERYSCPCQGVSGTARR